MELNRICTLLLRHGWKLDPASCESRRASVVFFHPARAPTYRLPIHRPHGPRLSPGATKQILKNAGISPSVAGLG